MRAQFLLIAALSLAACNDYEVRRETSSMHQRFEVTGAVTDILFYGDTSYSMQRELLTLGQNVDRFLDRVSESADDWQVIAVTGPDGCGQGGILTPDTPDYAGKFATGIMTPPPDAETTGSDEWGLYNVFRAVLETGPNGCNAGFLREEATLHVIFLSDEDDNSPGWERGGDYWRDYVDPVLFAKDSETQVRFSFVGGSVPNGCQANNAQADPGYGYWDAVQATDGEFFEICDDWAAELDVLADASISRDTFPLEKTPVVSSIQVVVNDADRTDGWAYETSGQAVRFFADVPRGGDVVELYYDAAE